MKKILLLTLLCAATIFVACEKEDNNNGPKPNTGKVFIAGIRSNDPSKAVATLWIDGTPTSLDNSGKDSYAESIYVSGEDIYVAGYVDKTATLWKNGIPTSLTDGTQQGIASSVFVSGSDVYVVGHEYTSVNNQTLFTVKIWKNGTPTILSSGTKRAYAKSVFVSGDKVYVAGIEHNGTKEVAVLWTNGVKSVLTDNTTDDSQANAVIAVGTDVYIVGFTQNTPTLWKNNKDNKTTLGANGIPHSLTVSDGKLHIVGSDMGKGMLWTKPIGDGAATAEVIPDTHFLNAIAASGSDIYMVGFKTKVEGSTAQMWKNKVLTNLSDESRTIASSVFVR